MRDAPSEMALAPTATEPRDRRARVLDIYQQCWNAFQDWHRTDARTQLLSLSPNATSHGDQAAPQADLWPTVKPEADKHDPDVKLRLEMDGMDASEELSFDSDGEGGVFEASTARRRQRVRCTSAKSGSEYESCDAHLQNLFLGPSERPEYPRVLPLGDQPQFDQKQYAIGFGIGSVPTGELDDWVAQFSRLRQPFAPSCPDVDMIELKTVLRARVELGVTLEELDDMKVLSKPLLPSEHDVGLLLSCELRDLVPWPSLMDNERQATNIQRDIKSRIASSQSIQRHLDILDAKMCTRLACLHTFCNAHPIPVHSNQPHGEAPPLLSIFKSLSSSPCGDDCFLVEAKRPQSEWSEQEDEKLLLTLSICRTLSPCQIAVLMQKPCYEIIRQRKQLERLHPEAFAPRSPLEVVRREEVTNIPRDRKHDNANFFHTFVGCQHDGACSIALGCPCALYSDYCSTNCGCGPNCGRQYPGCDCFVHDRGHKSKPTCLRTGNCLCIKRGRECQPGVCKGCKVERGRRFCSNAQMGSETPGKFFVRESEYGFGLFAREPIFHNKLIGEYVGECVAGPRGDAQQVLAQFANRNYLFEWIWTSDDQLQLSLDAFEAGNATRFINHPVGRAPNAEVRHVLVNGDLRLGIYAKRKIKKDEEIYLSYGDKFFAKESQDADGLQVVSSPERSKTKTRARLAATPSAAGHDEADD